MPTVNDLMLNLRSFHVRGEAKRAIKLNLKHMVMLNLGQLQEGKGPTGELFEAYADFTVEDGRSYAEMKHEMNPLPGEGNPDLKLTGNYYRGMFGKIVGEDIQMGSTDPKAKMLEEKYGGEDGAEIYGLQDENQDFWTTELVFPDFAVRFQQMTGLQFK